MNSGNNIYEYKVFEEKLGILYPHLKREEREKIIKHLFTFWENVLDSRQKIE